MKGKALNTIVLLIAAMLLLFSAACSQSKSTDAPPATSAPALPTAEQAKAAEPTLEPASGAVNSLKDVKSAIIQIESQGSFMDPQVGQITNGAGRGSGFIIDPSGIAVTNNHVVTGSGLLKVWIGGDQGKVYNAKVLGVSECSDLAVIDIEGEGFPYLAWYGGPIDVGTDIYVAGFPLGDPEFSLTKGIISKAKANGETSWASVESVVEYDATTNPGNSGGPVITLDGQVVAVHYAGNAQTRQAFGISRDIAEGVIKDLSAGQNQDTLGINGQAVANEDGSLTGVWVSSVQSGSPADEAGLEPGDIVTTMENLVLASDGTMADYCNILRSHEPTDTLSMQVLRYPTSEVLEGQINGRQLAVVGAVGDSGTPEAESTPAASGSDGVVYNPDASASGDVIYGAEFDVPLTDWKYFLIKGDESGFSDSIENGNLRVEISKPDTWLYYYFDLVEAADVRLDIKVENKGRNNNNVSLICRYSQDGWYEFNIANNGEYTIFRYDPTLSDPYVALFTGGSTLIKTGKGENEYTAVCKGNELTLGINGQLVRTVKDSNLDSGRFGLSLSSFSVVPIIAEFAYYVASLP